MKDYWYYECMNTSVLESYKTVVSEAWQTFKRNPLFILRVYIVVFVISAIFNFITEKISAYHEHMVVSSVMQGVVSIVGVYVNMLVSIGLTIILIHLVRKDRAEIKELFTHSKKILKTIAVILLLFAGTLIGLVLAIVPGVIFYLTFHFAVYRIIEREISIKQAFKESRDMLTGKRWYLLGIYFLIGLTCLIFVGIWTGILFTLFTFSVNMVVLITVSILALCSMIVVIPYMHLVCVHVYDMFVQQKKTPVTNPQMVADSLPLAG